MSEKLHCRAVASVWLAGHADPVEVDRTPAHQHDCGQLLVSLNGLYAVLIPDRSWLLPTHKGVWIPGNVQHRFSGRFAEPGKPVSHCSLYVPMETSPHLPRDVRLIDISPLLLQLMMASVAIPNDYSYGGRDDRIMQLIVDEICRAPAMNLLLPLPRDPRLQRICRAFAIDPERTGKLEDWARLGALSMRSLTRLFRDETGITFSAWRQQLRLMEALSRLGSGAPATSVALDLGYASPSAFAAMFRRAVGCSPIEYQRTHSHARMAGLR
jgi:AraC-like DNA-binding protein